MFELLMQFKTQNGHCDVPHSHVKQGITQRAQHESKNALEQRQVDCLEQAGFDWNGQDKKLDEMFALLLQFKTKNGDDKTTKAKHMQSK